MKRHWTVVTAALFSMCTLHLYMFTVLKYLSQYFYMFLTVVESSLVSVYWVYFFCKSLQQFLFTCNPKELRRANNHSEEMASKWRGLGQALAFHYGQKYCSNFWISGEACVQFVLVQCPPYAASQFVSARSWPAARWSAVRDAPSSVELLGASNAAESHFWRKQDGVAEKGCQKSLIGDGSMM